MEQLPDQPVPLAEAFESVDMRLSAPIRLCDLVVDRRIIVDRRLYAV